MEKARAIAEAKELEHMFHRIRPHTEAETMHDEDERRRVQMLAMACYHIAAAQEQLTRVAFGTYRAKLEHHAKHGNDPFNPAEVEPEFVNREG